MAQVPVFWVHPIGRSPQANAGFRKLDERGTSVAKQEFFIGRKVTRTSGRGLAVRFGPASRASLVISFCWQEGFYLFAENFVSCCVFLLDGEGGLFCRESSPFCYVCKRCICRGTFRFEQTRKQRSAFSKALNTSSTPLRFGVFERFTLTVAPPQIKIYSFSNSICFCRRNFSTNSSQACSSVLSMVNVLKDVPVTQDRRDPSKWMFR